MRGRRGAGPRLLAVLLAALAAVVALAGPAAAHPLGNFTVNSYAGLAVEPSAVRVDVVVDRAEIPTSRDFPSLDERTGELPGADARADALCAEQADGARLTADGRPLPLEVTAAALEFPPGAAGLRTARLTCALRTAELADELVGAQVAFELADVGGVGWRETTAVGDGVELSGSDVPQASVSDALRAYPEDLLSSPVDQRTAAFAVERGTGLATGIGALLDRGPVSALPRGADRFTQAFTDLVARDELTAPFVAVALGVALLLGGLHAFAPGHGKTVMAAVLVGSRGAWREAALLGAAVTVTHTAGVVVLGVLLTAVGLAAPEQVYPYLGVASGLLLVAVGLVLLRSARQRARARARQVVAPALQPVGAPGHHDHPHDADHAHESEHAHDHPHDHHHDHHHDHEHAPGVEHSHGGRSHVHALPAPGTGVRGLLAVGLAGGLVPSPSALVVLLGGIALGRTWFGLLLVVAYGVGMALVLCTLGLLLVRARGRLERLAARRPAVRAGRLLRALPTATAALVVAVGAVLTVRAAAGL